MLDEGRLTTRFNALFNCTGIQTNSQNSKENRFLRVRGLQTSKDKTGVKLKIPVDDQLKRLFQEVNGILQYRVGNLNPDLRCLCPKYLGCKVNKALLRESSKGTRSNHLD